MPRSLVNLVDEIGLESRVNTLEGAASTVKNYIPNAVFNSNTPPVAGWSLFNTTIDSTTKIPTGSVVAGAAGFNTLATTATTPLSGLYSLLVSTSAGVTITTTGFGFISNAFTIDREDAAKVLGFSFAYEAALGTMNFSGTSANTWAVYIRDVSGGAWIQPAGVYNLVQSSGTGICSGTFQTTAAGTQYQIAVMMINTVSSAVSMEFDSFQLGPKSTVQGAAISDWVSYTPTGSWTAGADLNYTGRWRRVGDSMEINASVNVTNTLAGTTALTVSLPSGFTIDTTKFATTASYTPLGTGEGIDVSAGNTGYSFQVVRVVGQNTLSVLYQSTTTAAQGGVLQTVPITWQNGDNIQIRAMVPISGWSSNTVMSNDTDTRVVAFSANDNDLSALSLTTTYQSIPFSVQIDTHAAYSSPNYIIPVSGWYKVDINTAIDGAVAEDRIEVRVLQDSSPRARGTADSAGRCLISYSKVIYCNAGSLITPEVRNTIANRGATAVGSGAFSFISIHRLSGPATIAASETVAMARAGSVVRSVPVAGAYLDFDNTSGFTDTHGAWRAGSGYVAGTGAWSVQPAYVVPVSGIYSVSARILLGSTAGFKQLFINKNGSPFASTADDNTYAGNFSLSMHGQIRCNAGDLLQVFFAPQNAQNAPSTVSNFWTGIEISRVGN